MKKGMIIVMLMLGSLGAKITIKESGTKDNPTIIKYSDIQKYNQIFKGGPWFKITGLHANDKYNYDVSYFVTGGRNTVTVKKNSPDKKELEFGPIRKTQTLTLFGNLIVSNGYSYERMSNGRWEDVPKPEEAGYGYDFTVTSK